MSRIWAWLLVRRGEWDTSIQAQGPACAPEASPRVTEIAQGDCVGQQAGQGQRLSRPSTTKGPQRKKSRGWKNTRRMQGHRMRVSDREWLTASDALKKPN